MIIIKGSTKKGHNMLERACYNDEGYSLREVYNSYSVEKENAYNECLAMCNAEGGHDFHIFSHNSFSFSVAWYVPQGVRIETSCNSYLVTTD